MSIQEIKNAIKVNDQILTGGQPTEDQLRSVAADGFSTVINIAILDPRYALEDEGGLVRSLGMSYFHIPVQWDAPKESDFDEFEQVMNQLPAGKTLIHCAANYRVTAFYSLYAQKNLGWSEDQAAAFRAQIWKDEDNPTWEEFIQTVKAKFNE
jgi:protein tyrosine phosphatase (PTP) superfamily phosphohydrolase (DUF442 family)